MKFVQGERTYVQKKDLILFSKIDALMERTDKELYDRICQIENDGMNPSTFYPFDGKSAQDYFDSFRTTLFDFNNMRTESEEDIDKEIEGLQKDREKQNKFLYMQLLIDNAIGDLRTMKAFNKTGKGLTLPQEEQEEKQQEKDDNSRRFTFWGIRRKKTTRNQ